MATGSARRSTGPRSTRPAGAAPRTSDLTSRPSREAANRLYRRIGFERARPTSTATTSSDVGRVAAALDSVHAAPEVLGGLADLPVAVGAGAFEGGGDVGGPGCSSPSNGARASTARRRIAGLVSPRRGWPSARRHRSRRVRPRPIRGPAARGRRRRRRRSISGRGRPSRTASRSPHDHAAISTTVASASARSGDRSIASDAERPARRPAAGRSRRDRRAPRPAARRRARRAGRARRAQPSARPDRRLARPRARRVADVARCPASGDRPGASASLLQQIGERRRRPHARPNARPWPATAPMTRASPELATTAHTRRRGPAGGRGSDGSWSPGRARRRGVSVRLRGGFGCALAVLRHPASTRATTARPAIQRHSNGEIVDRHAGQTLAPAPLGRGAHRAAPVAGHRWWAIPMVVLAARGPPRSRVAGAAAVRASSPTRR